MIEDDHSQVNLVLSVSIGRLEWPVLKQLQPKFGDRGDLSLGRLQKENML